MWAPFVRAFAALSSCVSGALDLEGETRPFGAKHCRRMRQPAKVFLRLRQFEIAPQAKRNEAHVDEI